MSETPSDELRQLRFSVAQLRHLYTHLQNGTFKSSKDLATGLLSPEIRRLENIIGRMESDDGTEAQGD